MPLPMTCPDCSFNMAGLPVSERWLINNHTEGHVIVTCPRCEADYMHRIGGTSLVSMIRESESDDPIRVPPRPDSMGGMREFMENIRRRADEEEFKRA